MAKTEKELREIDIPDLAIQIRKMEGFAHLALEDPIQVRRKWLLGFLGLLISGSLCLVLVEISLKFVLVLSDELILLFCCGMAALVTSPLTIFLGAVRKKEIIEAREAVAKESFQPRLKLYKAIVDFNLNVRATQSAQERRGGASENAVPQDTTDIDHLLEERGALLRQYITSL